MAEAKKRHVYKDLPLDVLRRHVGDIDEGFKQMNAGDTDERSREFDLDRAGVHMREPVRFIPVAL